VASREPGRTNRIEELERDLAEAIERQSATDQVLDVVGRSAFELQPVFETVLRQAVRLCGADAGLIYLLDGDVYRMAFALGGSTSTGPTSRGSRSCEGRAHSSGA
jgi:hypothetical protein